MAQTTEQILAQIQNQLATQAASEALTGIVSVAGFVELTSSNLSQSFSTSGNTWYSVAIYLVGGSSTDTKVNLVVATNTAAAPMVISLNSTAIKVNVKNVRLSAIYTDATSLSSGKLYIAYLGYPKPNGHPEVLF